MNPGFTLRLTVWSLASHFSSLSFLNSKMGIVTTVLYLFVKVIRKLPWDPECETLNKLQSAPVREDCTSAQQPGLQRTCRIPRELGSVAEQHTAINTQLSKAEDRSSYFI